MQRVTSNRGLVLRYGVALVVVGLLLLCWRVALHRLEPDPYPLLLVGVVVSAFYGGLGPGLLATVLSGAVGLYFYQHHAPQLDLFLVLSAFLTWLNAPLRRLQEELRHQVDFTKAISRNLEEGLCVIDRRGRITYTNASAERMLGWTQSELRGRPAGTLVFHSEAVREGLEQEHPLLKALHDGTSLSGDDGLFGRKDGTALPVSYTASPIKKGGMILGAVLAFRDLTSRNQTVETLRQSRERYRALVESSPDGILLTDTYGFVLQANRSAADLHGYAETGDMLGINVGDLYAPDDRQRGMQDRLTAVQAGSLRNAEYQLVRKDGSRFEAELSESLVRDQRGEPQGLTAFVREIGERKQAERSLHSRQSRLSMQYLATQVLSEATNPDEVVWKCLQTVCETSGWDVGLFWSPDLRQNKLRCRHIWHASHTSIPDFAHLSRQVAFAAGDGSVGTVWENGEPLWNDDVTEDVDFSRASMAVKENLRANVAFPIKGERVVHGVMEFFSQEPKEPDGSLMETMTIIGTQVGQFFDRKDAENALAHLSNHDPLTGLPNRIELFEALQERTSSKSSSKKRSVALLILDLDGFKEVNDALGHHYGDLLLQEVGIRLRDISAPSQTVARMGGDEFAFLADETDVKGAVLIAEHILTALSQPFVMEGQSLEVSGSIGIAVHPEHGQDASTLLRHADSAMYMAKRASSGYALYDLDLDEHNAGRLALIGELREAVEQGHLLVHYQPKVELKSGRPVSLEALVRWQHPEHGVLPPEQFIQLAEHAGLVQALSLHVLSSALKDCRKWHDEGLDARVAVNLSPRTLQDPQLVGMIAGLIRTCDCRAPWLEVEIAESTVMSDPDRAFDVITRLREMGVHVSLDDFAKGYSSVGQLKRLPITEVKIDKARVLEATGKLENLSELRSAIELGRKLEVDVLAEGVTTREMWDLVEELGCDLAQGSYAGAPLPASELTMRLGPEQLVGA